MARGIELRVGLRPSSDFAAVLPEVTDVVPLDFTGLVGPTLFEDVDALFFMTPLIDEPVPASKQVLAAAVKAGVPHVVRLSSRSASWDERSRLRAWQREIDEMVLRADLSSVILRPCSFFQNFITYQADSIRSLSSIIMPQGNGLIPYIDATDIGDAAAACLRDPPAHDGATYVLTGGRAYGAKGVAAEIGRAIGKPVTFLDIEEEQARHMMQEMGSPDWLIEAGLAVFAHARAGLEAAVDPALTTLIGRPATSLTEFVERNAERWM